MGPVGPIEAPQRAGKRTGRAHLLGGPLPLCTKPGALPCCAQLAVAPVSARQTRAGRKDWKEREDIHTMKISETHTWYPTPWFQ